VEMGPAIPSQLDPPTRLPSLQIKRYVAAAQMGSGEQIAFDTGQRRAMTLIGAAPHAARSLRDRTK
jgi:hypothetical protein